MTPPASLARRRILQALAAVPLAGGTLSAAAQAPWPSKPIRFVVTFAAGGSTSVFGRLLAEPLGRILGESVYIDNRAGAGGLVGVDNVAKSPPDGYSMVMTAAGPLAINPALMGDKLPYDPLKDLKPIIHLTDQPNVLVAHNSVPTASMAEFVAWAKANPGEGFATPGIATTNHITGELLSNNLGIKLTHVAYRGAAAATTDLLGGTIRLAIFNIVDAAALVSSGRVKPILVTTAQRSPLMPTVPTIQEAGGSSFPLVSWQGMFGPRDLPAAMVQKLNAAFNEALKAPPVQEWMRANGSIAVGGSTADFERFVASEHKLWGDLVRKYRITTE